MRDSKQLYIGDSERHAATHWDWERQPATALDWERLRKTASNLGGQAAIPWDLERQPAIIATERDMKLLLFTP